MNWNLMVNDNVTCCKIYPHKFNITRCTSCYKGAFKTHGELSMSDYEECTLWEEQK